MFKHVKWLCSKVAMVLTGVGLFVNSCSFIECGSKTDQTKFGLWHYQQQQTHGAASCRAYPDDIVVDAFWLSARAFSIITVIFATFVFVLVLYQEYHQYKDGKTNRKIDQFEATMYLLICTFHGLTLLFLASYVYIDSNELIMELSNNTMPSDGTEHDLLDDHKCSLGEGAKLIIAATVLWSTSAAISFALMNEEIQAEGRNHTVQPKEHSLSATRGSVLLEPLLDTENDSTPQLPMRRLQRLDV